MSFSFYVHFQNEKKLIFFEKKILDKNQDENINFFQVYEEGWVPEYTLEVTMIYVLIFKKNEIRFFLIKYNREATY